MEKKKLELTKADSRRIEEDARKAAFRIEVAATAYARLYEKTYLLRVRDMIDERIAAVDLLAECMVNASKPDEI